MSEPQYPGQPGDSRQPQYPGQPQYQAQAPYQGQPQYQAPPPYQGQPYPGQAAYPAYAGGGNAALAAPPKAPGSVTVAFVIFLLAAILLVVGVVVAVNSSIWNDALRDANITATSVSVSTLKTVIIAVGVIFAVLYLFFAFMMRAGRNWARIVLTVVAALSLGSSFSTKASVTVSGRVYSSSSSQLTGWIGVVLAVVAIVLMFLPASNAYFTASKAARKRR